ncbi:aldo/keto reductase family oxidoreductase [Shewanella sp. KT0246]|uniref:aldo/keto reductase n=1 Tax=Shewanella sp. KT0246 TaxID=2815912 RepID=UPI001BB9CC85|nr:aldo/keto reductase [Shewanella sp. KT0246]GIU50855.1 aldo/keto reductase [Shewanella sp. KT0246]
MKSAMAPVGVTTRVLPLTEHLNGVSDLVYGCMGLGGGWNSNPISAIELAQAHDVVDAALTQGINYFDHADIYTFGKAEQVFGQVLAARPKLREQMFIQSKCGIRLQDDIGPKRYDLSAQWINHSVDNSLKQLKTDYLDVLVLHRPDPLMQAAEIAETYHRLRDAGKVRFLGVSNMQQHQINAIQQALDTPLVVNQVELSLHKQDWIDETVYAGNQAGASINFTPGMLEYCLQQKLQVQSWGSLCQGLYSGVTDTNAVLSTGIDLNDKASAVQQTSILVSQLASEYGVSKEAIILAWLMQHPAKVQPVIGTTNLQRIAACNQAVGLTLAREHWYALYVSAKGEELP